MAFNTRMHLFFCQLMPFFFFWIGLFHFSYSSQMHLPFLFYSYASCQFCQRCVLMVNINLCVVEGIYIIHFKYNFHFAFPGHGAGKLVFFLPPGLLLFFCSSVLLFEWRHLIVSNFVNVYLVPFPIRICFFFCIASVFVDVGERNEWMFRVHSIV